MAAKKKSAPSKSTPPPRRHKSRNGGAPAARAVQPNGRWIMVLDARMRKHMVFERRESS